LKWPGQEKGKGGWVLCSWESGCYVHGREKGKNRGGGTNPLTLLFPVKNMYDLAKPNSVLCVSAIFFS
jgi:hypothetical protein